MALHHTSDELHKVYVKRRHRFGAQPMFAVVTPHLLDSIAPDLVTEKQYIMRNPVDQASQACSTQSQHETNTKEIVYKNTGANHCEGGWPKEIPYEDEEATTRYRKRVERSENYVGAIMNSVEPIKYYLDQNNRIDLYQHYYSDIPPFDTFEKPELTFEVTINDPLKKEGTRAVSSIDWTYESDAKVVVAYCNKKFQIHQPEVKHRSCYIWNLEYPTDPAHELLPPVPCWQLACSPNSPSVVIGGLENGRACIFDVREDSTPVIISPVEYAQRNPVSALLFVISRLNNVFFCGSSDGTCQWYDVRNMSAPTETLVISVNVPPGERATPSNAEPVSALEFDKAFPTIFYCGTETGLAVKVNLKSRERDNKIICVYKVHSGPVRAIQRSRVTSKMFMTCGDWSVNIWSEDILSSPVIVGTTHRYQIQDAVWVPHRVSSYMSVGDDGKFRYWDMLRKLNAPVLVYSLTKGRLLKIKPHEEGRRVAIGDSEGKLHLLALAPSLMYSGDNDKQLMMQMYERETRREHLLESRVKEIRLKIKAEVEAEAAARQLVPVDEVAELRAVDAEYKRVAEQTRKLMAASSFYKITRDF